MSVLVCMNLQEYNNSVHFPVKIEKKTLCYCRTRTNTTDDYAKDGRSEVVWHLCSFYQDPLLIICKFDHYWRELWEVNPKSTGLFPPGAALGRVGLHPICKIRFRHPRKLKFTGLIAYIMFYKICKFESLTIINDVIMSSLPKTMAKLVSYTNLHKIWSR